MQSAIEKGLFRIAFRILNIMIYSTWTSLSVAMLEDDYKESISLFYELHQRLIRVRHPSLNALGMGKFP